MEDGDLHTDYKRQRQFKWKGLDEGLELERRDSDGEEEDEEVGTAEEQWRLQRLEREKWMKGEPKVFFFSTHIISICFFLLRFSHLFLKILTSLLIYVSNSWPNGWTKLAEFFGGNFFFFKIRNFEFLLVFLKFHGQNWALRLVNNIILFRKRH